MTASVQWPTGVLPDNIMQPYKYTSPSTRSFPCSETQPPASLSIPLPPSLLLLSSYCLLSPHSFHPTNQPSIHPPIHPSIQPPASHPTPPPPSFTDQSPPQPSSLQQSASLSPPSCVSRHHQSCAPSGPHKVSPGHHKPGTVHATLTDNADPAPAPRPAPAAAPMSPQITSPTSRSALRACPWLARSGRGTGARRGRAWWVRGLVEWGARRVSCVPECALGGWRGGWEGAQACGGARCIARVCAGAARVVVRVCKTVS